MSENRNPPASIVEDELASREENLAFSRGILARLLGLPLLDEGVEGPCDDCRQLCRRYRLGHFEVCRPCAQRRQRAAEKAEAT
jgi:hypothetical protein